MRYMTLLIAENDGGHPCHSLLPKYISENSEIQCDVVQCMGFSNKGCALMRIYDPKALLAEDLKEREKLVTDRGECTIDRISPCRLTAMILNNNCTIARIISESGCVLVSSVQSDDGYIRVTIIGPSNDNLRRAMETFRNEGIEVKKVQSSYASFDSLLTPKQEETLRMALEEGYYDRPKRINSEVMAERLGCSKSTMSTTLRAAEKKVLAHYISNMKDAVR